MTTLGQQIRDLRKLLRAQLIEIYSTGLYTHEQIAKVAGCNSGSVYLFYQRWKKRYEFPPVPRGYRKCSGEKSVLKKEIKTAWELYNGGMSMAEVGRQYGVSREYVRQTFKSTGLKIRPVGGQK